MSKTIVIGGGVIGLFSAYYLAKEGEDVIVLDASNMLDGCSYGNAGMIVPSHVIPLAQPGMIAQGIKWMFNSRSPFYVRPRLSKDLLSWGRAFYKHATEKHVSNSKVALRDLSVMSKSLYQEISSLAQGINYAEDGLLMVFQSDKVRKEEEEAAEVARNLGLEVESLDHYGVSQLQPNCAINAIGGIHYKSDAHLDPNRLMKFLKEELSRMGVKVLNGRKVDSFVIEKDKIKSCKIASEEFEADQFVLATGSWSSEMAKQLKHQLRILPGKGYSFNVEKTEVAPAVPTILCEGKVAVTPFNDRVRFGGTLEITSTSDEKINRNRLQGIVNTANAFYPDLKVEMPHNDDVWYGFRPCTPTGMPIIGRSSQHKNLVICTGHAMMGLSLAPASGKLVSEIVNEREASVSIEQFN